MKTILTLITVLAITGCASQSYRGADRAGPFDAPTFAEQQYEREHANAYGRWQDGNRPPVAYIAQKAGNDAMTGHWQDTSYRCTRFANAAAEALRERGYTPRIVTVRLPPFGHTMGRSWRLPEGSSGLHTFVAFSDGGNEWAVTIGRMPFCDGICRMDEAMRGVAP